jgi:hypothetical protein
MSTLRIKNNNRNSGLILIDITLDLFSMKEKSGARESFTAKYIYRQRDRDQDTLDFS